MREPFSRPELTAVVIRAVTSTIDGRATGQLMAPPPACGDELDFLVPPGLAMKACVAASRAALETGWFLYAFRRFECGCSVALIRPGESGQDEIAQLSFVTEAPDLTFKLDSGMGLVLGISGLDGSGKTTLVERFIVAHRKAGGVEPQLVHLLPAWIPMPHQIFRRSKTQSNYTRPYSEPPVSSRLNGGLRLAYYLLAFTLARMSLLIEKKRGRLIILDRSFLDFASDLTRSRIPARRLPKWLLRALMPVGRLFFLDASPAVVVARKGELTLEKAHSLRSNYLKTCEAVDATLLNGDDTSDAVFKELLSHLSRVYMQRVETAAAH